MTKTTKTGRARGPLGMHHHRKPTPAATPVRATERRSGKPSTTAQVDPFALAGNAHDPVDPFDF